MLLLKVLAGKGLARHLRGALSGTAEALTDVKCTAIVVGGLRVINIKDNIRI